MENWRSIKGYEGFYEVSDLGRVKSLKRDCPNRHWNFVNERIMKPSRAKNNYFGIILHKNSIAERKQIARLVLSAFVPNPENKPQVNHKDGDKSNDKLSNLEWNTSSENLKHAFRTGLKKSLVGDKCNLTKLTETQVNDIREIYKTRLFTQKSIAIEYGVDQSLISYIINRKIWVHLSSV